MIYTAPLPTDKNGAPMQEFPTARPALAVNSSENNTASSVITLNDNATSIEVAAVGAAAAIKWIGVGAAQTSVISAAGTANYDHIVPPNMMRRFAVPKETQGVTSIVGANIQNGLYNRVAIKSVGAASVLTSQY